MSNQIDARGLGCPEPVILTMNAAFDQFDILVDNQVAVDNITRFCDNKGYGIDVKKEESHWSLTVTKKAK